MFRLTGMWWLSLVLIALLAGSCPAGFCPVGDLDGNCRVDWQDVLCFCEQWLDPPGCSGGDCADFIGGNGVDWADFALLGRNWLNAEEYLVINEFMASNSSRPPLDIGELVDGNGESSDWFEIYNPTDKTVILDGWYVTDNENDPTKWQFPDGLAIEDANYLVVFASEKKYEDYYPGNYPYLDPNGYYHTNFKLDVDGEYLAIVKPDGNTVVGSITFGLQSTDISYGRYPDARDNWLLMPVPTPGGQNNWGYLGIVADTKFSHNRGFYDSAFDVVITCATEGAVIHYTTDGTEPAESSPQYTVPIHISQTTSLRTRAFKPDYKPSNVDTHTYFFGVSAVRKSLPVISIIGDSEESLYEPNGVMAIVGGHYELVVWYPLSWVPNDPNDPSEYNNPIQHGIEYERPVSIELIYPDDNSGFQIDCGIRVQGSDWHRQRYMRANNPDNSEDWLGGPWNMEKFSFMLFFRSRYGQNRLEYPLFPLFDVDRFQSVALRGGFNDCPNPFLKDELYRRLHKDMGYVAGSGMMANVFINGHYKAYFNPCERIDTEFLQEWYNSDKEWDVITQYEPDKSVNGEVRDGDMVAWNALHDYAVSHDLTNDTHYQYVAKKFDITAFVDYLILEIYSGNTDWPRNNWIVAAERSDAGIFRFYLWDMEYVMRSGWLNRTAFENDWQSTGGLNNQDTPIPRLWRALKPNDDFRQLFADRVHKHFNNDGALVETNLANRFVELNTELLQVIPTLDTYALSTWIPQRRTIILAAFASELGFSGLDAPVFNINAAYQHGGYISGGDTVTMDNPNGTGTIYYTIDGSDPREGGGGISGSAIEYDGMPFALNRSTHLKARVWDGGQCSALNEAVFAVEGVAENLRITEIMYHPQDTGNPNDPNTEFIELKNIGPATINLSLVRFTEGIHYTFSPMELASGEYVVVVKDQNAFAARYDTTGMNIADGQYTGSLANNGERIRLEDAVGQTILDFDYEDNWHSITDGDGFSLTAIEPNDNAAGCLWQGLVAHWKLDRSNGAVAYDSAGQNHGTVYDAAWTDGRIDDALSFDGSGDYVAVPNPDDLRFDSGTQDFSIFAWIKSATGDSLSTPIFDLRDGNDDGWRFLYSSVERIWLSIDSKDVLSSSPIQDTDWHFVGAVIDRDGNGQIYIDGLPDGNPVAISSEPMATTVDAAIGKSSYDASGYFDGLIDDVRIYDRALSADQVWTIATSNSFLSRKQSWRPSAYVGGSPDRDDTDHTHNPGDIVINEVLAHSDVPPGDWIEMHNTTDSAIDITGWFLSDNDSNLIKYQIPSGTIIADGYIVFTEDDDFGGEFALSENGETVYLSSGLDTDGNLTGYRQQEDFGASDNDVAFGRYRKSTGTYNFVAASQKTPGASYEGATNAYPKVGPIVINEIMYHPDWFGTSAYNNDEFEYIELYNISGSAVTLYDSNENEPWKFTNGIDFTFPASPEVTIDPGQCVVVVRNPAAFAERFPAVPAEKILGPYEGQLGNDGEKLEISMPGGLEGDTRYYIRIDRVNYSDGSHHDDFGVVDPWPTEPDGDGDSLNRIFAQYYGNDPNNWQAAPPSPGVP